MKGFGFYVGEHGYGRTVFAWMIPGLGFRIHTLWTTRRTRRLLRLLKEWR